MRVRVRSVHLSLRGYPPRDAQQLAAELPAAVAAALQHPDRPVPGPAGAAGRAVAAAIRSRALPIEVAR